MKMKDDEFKLDGAIFKKFLDHYEQRANAQVENNGTLLKEPKMNFYNRTNTNVLNNYNPTSSMNSNILKTNENDKYWISSKKTR